MIRLRILLVEDEKSLVDVISARLKREKYDVDICLNGEDGLYNALTDIYDLLVLDIMLPKVNGFEILKKVKENDIKAKVIILTAKSQIDDKLEGLLGGADDYITKPFHIEELVARVNIQLRKKSNSLVNNDIVFGNTKLNIKESTLFCVDTIESINVVCKEFMLLDYFMNNPNQIISKEQIYDKVWGMETDNISNNLEAYLSFIRKKLKLIGSNINIKSVRGLGYKMEVINNEKIKG